MKSLRLAALAVPAFVAAESPHRPRRGRSRRSSQAAPSSRSTARDTSTTPAPSRSMGRPSSASGRRRTSLRRFKAAEQIDAAGSIVIPGLINTHGHAPMVLYRGLADDLRLQEWLEKYIFPAEAKTVSREMVRAGTRLAALEMIQSGTTAYADMYYFEEEIARMTKAAGMRGVLGQTIIQFPVADAKTPQEGLARTEAFIKEFAKDDLIVPAVAPHSPYTLDAKDLLASRALATKYGVPVLIHVAETETELGSSTEGALRHEPCRVPAVDRFLGSAHGGEPRRLGGCGRHQAAAQPPGRRVAQSRKQHEAGERHRASAGIPGRRGDGRPRHRRRGQQQRPRHVRSDAVRGAAAQSEDRRSARIAGDRGARDGDDSRARGLSDWRSRSDRSKPESAPISSSCRRPARG